MAIFWTKYIWTRRTARRAGRSFAVLLAAGLIAAPAQAAPHRARLSADLADHLASGSASVDVIVQGTRAEVDALAARYGLTVVRYLKTGAVLRMNAGQLDALDQDQAVDHLSGDVPIRSAMAVTDEAIGADQVWAGVNGGPGYTGRGVGVAVIDSGIDTKHNALKRQVVATVDFTGGDGHDGYGHGTHVAGIIAGLQGRTPDTGSERGVASGASLVNLRVLDDTGSGKVSDVIDAIDWAIDHKTQFNIRVINLSLGTPVLQPYADDPLCAAVERAVTSGIVVVASAGNYGKTADGKLVLGGITSPGNSPYALTVGAIDTHATPQRSDDTVATFSSRGPTAYDMVLKPDLVAPGVRIESAEASNSYLATTYPQLHVAGNGPNAYMRLSGTSMAAGVVSGAVALLLDEQPQLGPLQVRTTLQLTSTFSPSAGIIADGAGSLDVLAAAEFAGRGLNAPVTIAGEQIQPTGLTFNVAASDPAVWGGSIVWGARGQSIVWGADSIVWGGSIVWGADSIVWGSSDSIVWGSSDSIVWGSSDSIVWGGSIVWGSDSIVWGAGSDSIVWGGSIVWGADSIVWGADSVNPGE